MSSKITFIFNMATAPDNLAVSNVHTGGWSESFWQPANVPSTFPAIAQLALKRAALLPKTASIVGVRIGLYTIDGNRLLPNGASTFSQRFPGSPSYDTDLPQVSLMCSGRSLAGANSSKLTLRCIPDEMMVGGEYKPTANFTTALNNFFTELTGGKGWSFLGRILSNDTGRVEAVAGGDLTTDLDLGLAKYVRFLRVYNTNGDPVTGSFRITGIGGPPTVYHLAGLPAGTVVANSGLCRSDAIALLSFNAVSFKRAVVRKIGRPSESYRGRASRRR